MHSLDHYEENVVIPFNLLPHVKQHNSAIKWDILVFVEPITWLFSDLNRTVKDCFIKGHWMAGKTPRQCEYELQNINVVFATSNKMTKLSSVM